MDIRLKKKRLKKNNQLTLNIGGSKSESNRLLLLKQLFPSLEIENISPSKDTDMMSRGLHLLGEEINVGDAGTAMRFLTAYYACCTDRKVVLTGSERMQQRPIGILVEALRQLGASIDYLSTEGFPPLSIIGKHIEGGELTIKANVSSQYLSALLLVGSTFPKGLTLHLEGEITSLPYLRMTLALLNQLGIEAVLEDNIITVYHSPEVEAQTILV